MVEMDAKIVTDAFAQQSDDLSEFGDGIRYCQNIARNSVDLSVSYIPRQANHVADLLASSPFSGQSPMFWDSASLFIWAWTGGLGIPCLGLSPAWPEPARPDSN